MVAGDRVQAAIGQRGPERLAIGRAAERRRALERGRAGRDVLARKRQVVRARLRRDGQPCAARRMRQCRPAGRRPEPRPCAPRRTLRLARSSDGARPHGGRAERAAPSARASRSISTTCASDTCATCSAKPLARPLAPPARRSAPSSPATAARSQAGGRDAAHVSCARGSPCAARQLPWSSPDVRREASAFPGLRNIKLAGRMWMRDCAERRARAARRRHGMLSAAGMRLGCGAVRPARLRRGAVGQLRVHQQRRARRGQHRQRGRYVCQRRVGEVVDACGRAAGGRCDVRTGSGLGHAGARRSRGSEQGLGLGHAGARAPDGHRKALRPSALASSSARSAAGSRALAGTSPPQNPTSTHSLPCARPGSFQRAPYVGACSCVQSSREAVRVLPWAPPPRRALRRTGQAGTRQRRPLHATGLTAPDEKLRIRGNICHLHIFWTSVAMESIIQATGPVATGPACTSNRRALLN